MDLSRLDALLGKKVKGVHNRSFEVVGTIVDYNDRFIWLENETDVYFCEISTIQTLPAETKGNRLPSVKCRKEIYTHKDREWSYEKNQYVTVIDKSIYFVVTAHKNFMDASYDVMGKYFETCTCPEVEKMDNDMVKITIEVLGYKNYSDFDKEAYKAMKTDLSKLNK